MRRMLLLVAIVVSGCSDDKKAAPSTPPAPKRFDGPMPITFGDCGNEAERFVSGPRPLPFAIVESSGLDTPITPPPPATREQALEAARTAGIVGATGTAPTTPTPAAVELARNAGYLGVAAGTDAFELPGDLLGAPAASDRGGFGFSGSGQANTGPSYGGALGTIGIGRIGHGSGNPASPSPLSLGTPKVTQSAHLHPAIVRRYIKRQSVKLSYCYERRLLSNASLKGTVNLSFAIGADGLVPTSEAKGIDAEVASCVAGVIKKIEFPKPKQGQLVRVEYALQFKPVDGAAKRVADEELRRRPPPPSLYGPNPSIERTYVPGAANPLRLESKAIEDCVRAGTLPTGTLVVELIYDAAGKTTGWTIHGTEDEPLKRCIGQVAANVTRLGTLARERCSLSFGQSPLAQQPALEITAEAVVMNGKTIVDTKAIIETVNQPTVPALVTIIADRVAAALRSDAPVVAVHGPLVVKPANTTTMRVVKRVLASVLAGGDDFVLATQGARGWELVTPLTLPVVPVPIATGGAWNPLRVDPGLGIGYVNDSIPTALVMKDKVEVSGSAAPVTVPVGDLQTKLPEALKAYASGTQLRLVVRDDVTYADFVAVVKLALAVGLTNWQLVAP